MRILNGIGLAVLAVVLIAAVVVGGWRAGWWFKEQNVERQAHIYRKSYANQERLREDALEKVAAVRSIEVKVGELGPGEAGSAQELQAQASAIGSIACRDIAQVSELEPELESFAAGSCAATE